MRFQLKSVHRLYDWQSTNDSGHPWRARYLSFVMNVVDTFSQNITTKYSQFTNPNFNGTLHERNISSDKLRFIYLHPFHSTFSHTWRSRRSRGSDCRAVLHFRLKNVINLPLFGRFLGNFASFDRKIPQKRHPPKKFREFRK